MQTSLQLEGLCPQAWDTCSFSKRASLPVDLHNYLKKQLARNDLTNLSCLLGHFSSP